MKKLVKAFNKVRSSEAYETFWDIMIAVMLSSALMFNYLSSDEFMSKANKDTETSETPQNHLTIKP